MTSITAQVAAVAIAGALFLGSLELGFQLLGRRNGRVWVIWFIGCLLMLFLGWLPATITGSKGILLPSMVVLGVLLASWTIVRAGNLLNRDKNRRRG